MGTGHVEFGTPRNLFGDVFFVERTRPPFYFLFQIQPLGQYIVDSKIKSYSEQ